MVEYRYTLMDGETELASVNLSDIGMWISFDAFTASDAAKDIKADINNLQFRVSHERGIRIGSKKRIRGMMQAAGWQRNDINAMLHQCREPGRGSFQNLWCYIAATALIKKAYHDQVPTGKLEVLPCAM